MNELGSILVQATQNRGLNPIELARQATDRIIYVGDQSHPVIRDQAQAFKAHIQAVLTAAFIQVVDEHNVTLAHRFNTAGHPELIPLLKR
jgi:hypothetical protein